jgi:hypothetical protein
VLGFLGVNASRQSGLGCGAKFADDRSDLGRGFTCPVDNFWCTKTFLTGKIEVGESARQDGREGATSRHSV